MMHSGTEQKKSSLPCTVLVLLLLTAVLSAVFFGVDAVRERMLKRAYPTRYEEFVIECSEKYGLEASLILAVIRCESGFRPDAVSRTGAVGLMQIMPDAFDWIKFRLDDDRDITFDSMFEPEYNIQYGTYMLSYLYDQFGSYELASAAYHQGMNAVQGWIDDGTIDPDHFSVNENLDAMPSDLTQDYIYRVMKAFDKYKENSELEAEINNE